MLITRIDIICIVVNKKRSKMNAESIIKKWFKKWEEGDYLTLPVSDNFKHTSPFGTIQPKEQYINVIKENKDKFLGYRFEIHDEIFEKDRACVRYTATKDDFSLDVSEWYYIKNGLIEEIISYYHIGEIRDERKLADKSE